MISNITLVSCTATAHVEMLGTDGDQSNAASHPLMQLYVHLFTCVMIDSLLGCYCLKIVDKQIGTRNPSVNLGLQMIATALDMLDVLVTETTYSL
jgi:hypothetical protein